MTQLSIRWRLTLWFWLVLLVVMTSFAFIIYSMMATATERHLSEEVSDELEEFGSELKWSIGRPGGEQAMQLFYNLHSDYLFEAITADDARLIASSEDERPHLIGSIEPTSNAMQFSTRTLPECGRCRVAVQPIDVAGEPVVIAIAVPLKPYQQILSQFRGVLVFAGLLMLLIALGAGYFLACQALSPVQDFCRAVEQVTAEKLDKRIQPPHPTDELGRLAGTFNEMLERLDRSFEELRIFTADAAHELRTPLAVLRSTLDVALQADRSPERYAEVLRDATEDVERLSVLADRLLLLSKEDSRIAVVPDVPIDVAQTLTRSVSIMQTAAAKKGITLAIAQSEDVTIRGDEDRLNQVWVNLLDNAIKFSSPNSEVAIHVTSTKDSVSIVIEDCGSGIPPDQVHRVFDRFYRVDPSRNRVTGGAGLGLAICKAIITAHAGTIQVSKTSTLGTSILVKLPLDSTRSLSMSSLR